VWVALIFLLVSMGAMDSSKVSHFKSKLQEELALLEKELSGIGIKNPENPSDWEAKETSMDTATPMADSNEAADKIEEYDENRAIVDELEIRYNNIKRALAKADSGAYGTCEICGEPIEEDRLEVNPAARTCKTHLNKEDELT
jgi:RNA polymerase-binding transcription factor DksA